ncbi:hypothetical protein HKX48_001007 [Thoreauomyces humboldtii]|nr:hypothetical protein HKX48_001007 [Thoreauomyces humboldtii]
MNLADLENMSLSQKKAALMFQTRTEDPVQDEDDDDMEMEVEMDEDVDMDE